MFFCILVFIIFRLSIQTNANETMLSPPTDNCTVKHGENLLKEGEIISIKSKLYKVEDCKLQRAYHLCGIYILNMVSFVCRAIAEDQERTSVKKNVRRFTQKKLLIDTCCLSVCTISEMARYCTRGKYWFKSTEN